MGKILAIVILAVCVTLPVQAVGQPLIGITEEFIAGTVGALVGAFWATYPDLFSVSGQVPEKICTYQEEKKTDPAQGTVTTIITQSQMRANYRLGVGTFSAMAVGYVRLSKHKGIDDPFGRPVLVIIGLNGGLALACMTLPHIQQLGDSPAITVLKLATTVALPALITGWFASVGLK